MHPPHALAQSPVRTLIRSSLTLPPELFSYEDGLKMPIWAFSLFFQGLERVFSRLPAAGGAISTRSPVPFLYIFLPFTLADLLQVAFTIPKLNLAFLFPPPATFPILTLSVCR